MPPRIKSIDVEAFRGIPHLHVPLEGRGLVMLGENGTGKSSLVEALEFFFTGTILHLEGVQGISAAQHAPHIHYTSGDVAVTVCFDPGGIELTRTFAVGPTPPEHLSGYFSRGGAGFILRRLQILEFIASRPAERFRALASLIGVEDLDSIELEMMRARDDLVGEEAETGRQGAQLLEALADEMQAKIASLHDVLPALNNWLASRQLPALSNLHNIQAHAETMLKSVKSGKNVEIVARLGVAAPQAQEGLFGQDLLGQMRELEARGRSLLDQKASTELRLADLIELGRQAIENERMDTCPICGQDIRREALLAELTSRLGTLGGLREASAQIRALAAAAKSALRLAETRVSALASELAPIESIQLPALDAARRASLFTDGSQALQTAADLSAVLPAERLADELASVEGLWSAVSKEIQGEIARLGVTAEEKDLLEAVRLIGSVKDKVERLEKVSATHSALVRNAEIAAKIYGVFSDSKRRKVADIYDSIQGDIRKYYSMLHPQDAHTDITLRLRSGQRASTELRMTSFGRKDEDPRALTSEGHLDSLGLCIFLAFVKNFNGGCQLLVLDDVVATIDSGHRQRICDLLVDEFRDYQVIITTQDGIWYRELAAAQRAAALENSFLNLEIASWSLDAGPQIDRLMPRNEEIERRLQANDKAGAGNEARSYLEWLLKKIALNTNASVPVAQWQSGTVGDLEPAVKARILKMPADADYLGRLGTCFQDLEKTTFFGNLVSHDNPLVDALSIQEVRAFYEAVEGLRRAVACTSCGSQMAYVKDARELRCRNKRCKSPSVFATTV